MTDRLNRGPGGETPNDFVSMVRTVQGYFTPAECDEILRLAEAAPRISGAVGEAKAGEESIRKSVVTALYPDADTAWVFDKLEYALHKLNEGYGFDLRSFAEGVQVAWYGADGGHYDWHVDIGPGRYSLRKLSMSVQLSDPGDYQGGELEFMAAQGLGDPQRGSMIVFPSFLEHRVRPVTAGTRASMVSWISGPAFR